MAQPRLSRDDLESKFREVQHGLQGRLDEKKQSVIAVAAVGGVVLLLIFFMLGKRSGKKRTTFVEIRRV